MDYEYEVIGVKKGCSVEELKQAYKTKAAKVHPMNGGSLERFGEVTRCFHAIYANIVGMGATNTPVGVDRNEFLTPDGKIDQAKFDEIFEKSRVSTAFDHGYGDQMIKSSASREDFSFDVPEELKTKFDNDTFNAIFNNRAKTQQTPKPSSHNTSPEPLGGAYDHFESLADNVSDFSCSNASGLAFTDYMVAHTASHIIDPNAVDTRPEFKSVKEYMKFREDDIKSMPKRTKADTMNDVLKSIDADIEQYDKVLLRDMKLFHKA